MSEKTVDLQSFGGENNNTVIEFKDVSKTYQNGTHALNDVNITINKGEFVFVVGSSGAGKSTFMKLIMREEKANTGSITVNGFNLRKMKRKHIPMLRRTMGIVFQDFRLIPKMNVFDNVAFAMRVVGAPSRQIRREVPKALAAVGLGDKARSMPNELSGGEQQRVGLARALVNNPALIIADEPTGNVDPNMSYEIVSMLTAINKQGTTVLMVTHDHSLVRDFKHRVIMLDDGKIVADNLPGGDEE
ncbi:MAG: cell division ATP-binding protein FtsE [Clostridia bacterium]|nr:cell division ATP-binding protein FtsE [Clostridia bacterium]